MIPTTALEALATLVEYAFVGRILLSFLPPGLPGRHSPRDLPATWAASHLLGSVTLAFELRLLERFGIAPHPLVLLAPWALLALARWITLPGAMVPRHEPAHEASGTLETLLLLASALAVLASPFFRAEALAHPSAAFEPDTPLRIADALALLALVSFGLSTARRAPLGRAVAVLALAAALATAIARSFTLPIPLTLALGGGLTLGVSWLRRGDRRAAALAVIALSGSALLGPRAAIFGAAGLFALWLHTAPPSRPNLALLSTALFAVCAILGFPMEHEEHYVEAILPPMSAATLIVIAFALAARKKWSALREEAARDPGSAADPVDSPRPQGALVRDALILCVIAMASRDELSSLSGLCSGLLTLAPLAVIDAALLLASSEIPPPAAATTEAESGRAGR
jgi:hypothetical protein